MSAARRRHRDRQRGPGVKKTTSAQRRRDANAERAAEAAERRSEGITGRELMITLAELAARIGRGASRSETIRTLRSLADRLEGHGGGAGAAAPDVRAAQIEAWRRIYAAWVQATGRDAARTKPTRERREKVLARLAEGYEEAAILAAVEAMARDPWHRGENDRGKRYDDLTVLCRNGSKLEQWIEAAGSGAVDAAAAAAGDEGAALRRRLAELEEAAVDALDTGDQTRYDEINAEIARLRRGAGIDRQGGRA